MSVCPFVFIVCVCWGGGGVGVRECVRVRACCI